MLFYYALNHTHFFPLFLQMVPWLLNGVLILHSCLISTVQFANKFISLKGLLLLMSPLIAQSNYYYSRSKKAPP